MKLFYFFLIVLGFVVLSCSNNQTVNRDLNNVESIIEVNADSALYMLDNLSNRNDWGQKELMRYRLLHALASIIGKKPISNDIEFNEVLQYYNTHGSGKDRSRANFVMGSLIKAQEDAPLALQYLNDAISEADTTRSNGDHWLLSKVYEKMSDIATQNQLYDYALDWSQKGIDEAYQNKDTLTIIAGLRRKALIFHKQVLSDYAVKELEVARELYRSYGKPDQAYRLALWCASYSFPFFTKDHEKIAAYLEEYEKYSGLIDSEGEPIANQLEYLWTKGRYYFDVNDYQNAEKYLRRVHHDFEPTEETLSASIYLIRLYTNRGDSKSALDIISAMNYHTRSAETRASKNEIIKYNALYNYTVQKSQKEKIEKEAQKYRYWLSLTIIAIIVILLITYIIINKYRSNKRRAAEELKQRTLRYEELKIRLNSALDDLKISEASLEEFKKIKEAEAVELQKDYYLVLLDQLHHRAARGESASESDMNDVSEYIKESRPTLFRKLAEMGCLSIPEIQLCYLIALKFTPSEDSSLMNLSPQRITNMKRSINEKLFNEASARTLDNNIENL